MEQMEQRVVTIAVPPKRIAVTGNTYPVKEEIKALGGKWDPDRKAWMVPATRAVEAQALVDNAPKGTSGSGSGGGTSSSGHRDYRPTKCVACGVVAHRDRRGYPSVRIYRSGECQDCYEERKMGY